ncbi:MAG: hypothetical protein ACE5JH_05345 [Acidobacteriota bacterium]
MKTRVLAAAAIAVAALGLADGALAGGAAPTVSLSSDVHVPEDVVHRGELVAILGDVRIDGSVTGEVVVILGSLHISGTVESDVVSILSRTTLTDTAVVEGELVNIGWDLDRARGSRVDGEMVNVDFMSLIPFSGKGGGISGLLRVIFLLKLAALAFLFFVVLLVAALMPRRVSLIAAALPLRWGWAILAGILAWSAFTVSCCLLAITLIGIPLAMALGLAMVVTKWLGLAAILFLLGQTLGRNVLKRDLPHLSCVLGGFVVYALLSLVPVFGGIFKLALSVLAVGLAIVSRFGTEGPLGSPVAAGAPSPGAPPHAGQPPESPAAPPPAVSPGPQA